MNKKDYIDAVNEIEVSEELKRRTLNKITAKKKSYKLVYSLAGAMMVFALALTIAIPMQNNKNKVTTMDVITENDGLPKIGSFENLYNKLNKYNENLKTISADTVMAESTNIAASIQESSVQTAQALETDDYYKTNVQVEGVEEADIVKTQGDYIYYIANDKVVIINCKNPKKLTLASKIEFEDSSFYPEEIYLYENKLVVIGQNDAYSDVYNTALDLMYMPEETTTTAKIYNIENNYRPKLEREVSTKGNYISSRMIDNYVYFVTNQYLNYTLCNKYDSKEITEDAFKPYYNDSVKFNEGKYIEFEDIYCIPETEDTSYLNVLAFDVNLRRRNKNDFVFWCRRRYLCIFK